MSLGTHALGNKKLSIAIVSPSSQTIEWTTKSKRSQTAMPWAVLAVRVAALAKLGRDADARTGLEELLEAYPNLYDVIEDWRGSFRDELIEGLKIARMPDG